MKTYEDWLVEQVLNEFAPQVGGQLGNVSTPGSLATRRDFFLQKLSPYGGKSIRWKAAQLAQIIPALQFKNEEEAIRALRLAMTQVKQGNIPTGTPPNEEQPG